MNVSDKISECPFSHGFIPNYARENQQRWGVTAIENTACQTSIYATSADSPRIQNCQSQVRIFA